MKAQRAPKVAARKDAALGVLYQQEECRLRGDSHCDDDVAIAIECEAVRAASQMKARAIGVGDRIEAKYCYALRTSR